MVRGFVFVVLAGTAATVAILWPLGAFAGRIHQLFDLHAYEWLVDDIQNAAPWWEEATSFFTKIGDPIQCVVTVVVLSAIMTIAWPGRRWVAASLRHRARGRVVQPARDRSRRRARLSALWQRNLPSGGTARIIVIYGAFVVLATIRWPRMGRRWRLAAWAGVCVLTIAEAYSRLFPLRHWPLDVPAGALFGVLLLVTMAVATIVLVRAPRDPDEAPGPR